MAEQVTNSATFLTHGVGKRNGVFAEREEGRGGAGGAGVAAAVAGASGAKL